MSLVQEPRPGEMSPETAVRLWVEATSRHHGLDPLYRRRLRGRILNELVAARETPALSAVASRRQMGTLGRACLYASVAVAMSVGSALAASGAAIPGDALYPVKRHIEEIRANVLPPQFEDELAALAFSERTEELSRLIEAGDAARAAALLPEVRAAYERLVTLRPDVVARDRVVRAQLSALHGLLGRLPDQASAMLRRALERAPGLSGVIAPGRDPEREPPGQSGASGNGIKGAAGAGGESGNRDPGDEPATSPGGRGPESSESPEPTPTAEPAPSDEAAPSPKAHPSPKASQIDLQDEQN